MIVKERGEIVIEKMIDLENGNKYSITQDGFLNMITKYCTLDGVLEKIITFKAEYDFLMEAWTFDEVESLDQVEFLFDDKDLLYRPLLNLLGIDDNLIIDDDLTREDNKKIVVISKENNRVKITFENKLKEDLLIQKFDICVINILESKDGRSKIDQKGYDTKYRLKKFFEEIYNGVLYGVTEINENKQQKIYKKDI